MQVYFLCYATACLILTTSPIGGPRWSPDYDASVSAARSSHRPLLLVLEDSANPSSKFQLADAAGATEQAELLDRFVTCRLDMRTRSGRLIAEGYSVSEFPCVLISDEDCRRVVFRGVGQLNKPLWEETLANNAGPCLEQDEQTVACSTIQAPRRAERPLAEAKAFQRVSLKEAQRAARRRGRPLIVYVGTENCSFCQKMRDETLENQQVNQEVAAGFESVAIENSDETSWAEGHGLRIYPTTLVFGNEGELIDRMEGFVRPMAFLQRLKMTREYLLSTTW